MAVPRNRHSNARKNTRRAHDAKKPTQVSTCSNCEKPRLSHRMCSFCGFYSGRAMINEEKE